MGDDGVAARQNDFILAKSRYSCNALQGITRVQPARTAVTAGRPKSAQSAMKWGWINPLVLAREMEKVANEIGVIGGLPRCAPLPARQSTLNVAARRRPAPISA